MPWTTHPPFPSRSVATLVRAKTRATVFLKLRDVFARSLHLGTTTFKFVVHRGRDRVIFFFQVAMVRDRYNPIICSLTKADYAVNQRMSANLPCQLLLSSNSVVTHSSHGRFRKHLEDAQPLGPFQRSLQFNHVRLGYSSGSDSVPSSSAIMSSLRWVAAACGLSVQSDAAFRKSSSPIADASRSLS